MEQEVKFGDVSSRVARRYNKQFELFSNEEVTPLTTTYAWKFMCQVYLPYAAIDGWVYKAQQGDLTMRVTSGATDDPETGEQVPRGVPYGTRARLLLYLLNEIAIRKRAPHFRLCKSLRDLARKLGIGQGKQHLDQLKQQLMALTTAKFEFSMIVDGRPTLVNFAIVKQLTMPRALKGVDEAKVDKSIDGFYVRLDEEYFRVLVGKAVPLDKRAINGLKNAPMALDIYNWLTQRLCRIPQDGKGQFVSWANLYQQFGSNYAAIRNFKARFRKHLADVRLFYRCDVREIPGKGYTLHYTPPPVAPQEVRARVAGANLQLRRG